MIKILYTTLRDCDASSLLERYRSCFTLAQIEATQRFRKEEDRQRSLLGKLLLRELLDIFGLERDLSLNIQQTRYKRPYVGNDLFDYNISHSGQYILCIASDETRVGIDVEEMKSVCLSDYRFALTEQEWSEVLSAEDPQKAFYKLWCIKESALKADGRGLIDDLGQVKIFDEYTEIGIETWNSHELSLDAGYMVAVSYREGEMDSSMQYVDF